MCFSKDISFFRSSKSFFNEFPAMYFVLSSFLSLATYCPTRETFFFHFPFSPFSELFEKSPGTICPFMENLFFGSKLLIFVVDFFSVVYFRVSSIFSLYVYDV